MDKATILQALVLSAITGLIGLVLFFGSVHAGGASFFAGMFFMPFLYLDYKGLVPIDSLLITIILGLVAQFIICYFIVTLTKRILSTLNGNNSNAI